MPHSFCSGKFGHTGDGRGFDTIQTAHVGSVSGRPVEHSNADPHQRQKLWGDPSRRSLRDDLVADLYDSLPRQFNRLGMA